MKQKKNNQGSAKFSRIYLKHHVFVTQGTEKLVLLLILIGNLTTLAIKLKPFCVTVTPNIASVGLYNITLDECVCPRWRCN